MAENGASNAGKNEELSEDKRASKQNLDENKRKQLCKKHDQKHDYEKRKKLGAATTQSLPPLAPPNSLSHNSQLSHLLHSELADPLFTPSDTFASIKKPKKKKSRPAVNQRTGYTIKEWSQLKVVEREYYKLKKERVKNEKWCAERKVTEE